MDTPVATPISVRFNQPMDQTVTPAPAFFDLFIDSISRAITNVAWGATDNLEITFAGLAPAVDAKLSFDSFSPSLRNIEGVQAKPPQSISNVV